MRFLLIASLIACSATTPEPIEPEPPAPDAAPTVTPSTDVFAASFDRYCTRDDDCVAVFEGNACESCRCANAAIRRDALPRFRAELGAFWSCHDPSACAADCRAVTGDPAICVANTCTLAP